VLFKETDVRIRGVYVEARKYVSFERNQLRDDYSYSWWDDNEIEESWISQLFEAVASSETMYNSIRLHDFTCQKQSFSQPMWEIQSRILLKLMLEDVCENVSSAALQADKLHW